MRVRRDRHLPSAELRELFKLNLEAEQIDGFVTPGKEYLVYGMDFDAPRPDTAFGPVAWGPHVYLFDSDFGNQLLPFPLYFFTVTDPRVSRHWTTRTWPDGDVSLWPQEFYLPYFHDHLSNNMASAVQAFERARQRLESEFLE